MDDASIIQLFWDRNERAISSTSEKYGNYCATIAKNILGNNEDAEECVNDTYLNAWNAMPPHRPQVLSAFLGKITRNLSLNRYKLNNADKRGGGELPAILDELAEIVSGNDDVEQEVDRIELSKTINDFLSTLPNDKRNIFVCRYWFSESVTDIAKHNHITENNVSVQLSRTRVKLHDYLLERGFEL